MDTREILFILGFVVSYGIVTLSLVRWYWGRTFKNQEMHSSIVIPIKFLVLEFVVLSLIFGFEDVAWYVILDAGGNVINFNLSLDSSPVNKIVWDLLSILFIPWLIPLIGYYVILGKFIFTIGKNTILRSILVFAVSLIGIPFLISFIFLPLQLLIKGYYTPMVPFLFGIPDMSDLFWDFVNFMLYLSLIFVGNIFSFIASLVLLCFDSLYHNKLKLKEVSA